MLYQSHSETEKGTSKSDVKLGRLRMPRDMSGLRFLDIGCNEGFFCNVAAERGATVVGIDFDAKAIEFARGRYASPSITFLCQGWKQLPDGPFDIVLWASSMHYELDPRSVVLEIKQRLSPKGFLILECGVDPSPTKEMVQRARPTDTRWYPTTDYLLDHILAGFAVRRVASPALTDFDPVPRSVYHCTPGKSFLLLVRGGAAHGKTSLSRLIGKGAEKVISLDRLIERIAGQEKHHSPVQQFIKENAVWSDLESLYKGIDENSLTAPYVAMLVNTIAPSDKLVVLEGFLTEPQVKEIHRQLAARAIVWDAKRVF